MPEAPLSRGPPPAPKGDSLWGPNWERPVSSGRKPLRPHRPGSTAGSWAPRRPGHGRTARRRSTPPGPGTAGTSLGDSAGCHLPEPQNLPNGPPIRGHSTRPARGTRGGLPHALHTLPLPHRFPAPGAGLTLLGGPVGRHGPLPHHAARLPALAHHGHGLALVVLAPALGRAVVGRGCLLVHHGHWGTRQTPCNPRSSWAAPRRPA